MAYQTLRDAYVFLRHLIDALRLASGQAHDLVLPAVDTDAFIFLARRMGYWEEQGTLGPIGPHDCPPYAAGSPAV